jgi:tetratricopeptide (TPR) repeat protein
MRKLMLLPFALLAATPTLADRLVLDDPALPGGGRYQRCLNLVNSNPRGAYEAAGSWSADGGGAPSRHCAALALVGLQRYAEGAARLDALGRDVSSGDLVLRGEILDQAGNAWLLAGKGDNAAASFTAALSYSINNPDYLADRAQARALNRDWRGAEADLTSALAVYPTRVDLLVLRSSARRALGRRPEARSDIDKALTIKPADPDALVERGTMRFEDGDIAGAKADWQKAISIAPGSNAAASARRYVESIDAPK